MRRFFNSSGLTVCLPLLGTLIGCGQLPGFTVDSKSDSFMQSTKLNDKIDILFVVDNSGSMADKQTLLAQSFDKFIEHFSTRNLDFHLGVLSTDNTRNTDYWAAANQWAANGAYASISPYIGIFNGGPGTLLSRYSGERFLTSKSTDYVNKFKANVQLGAKGSGAEGGLLSAITALNATNLDPTTGYNAGFVRDGAFLAIIVISDDDEARNSTSDTNVWTLPTEKQAREDLFISEVKGLKPDHPELVRFDAIVAPSKTLCTTAESSGDLYMEIASMLGGRTIPVCQDFSQSLDDLGAEILTLVSRFHLLQPPAGPITVYVDGVVVPQDSVNGWVYLADTQDIEFRGNAVPDVNSHISVNYVPAAPTN